MKDLKIKLISNRVLIQQDPPANLTKSGIILIDKEELPSTQGTVIIVGPGAPNYEMETKVGDHVLYNKDSGIEVTLDDGKDYLIMRETEIKMIL